MTQPNLTPRHAGRAGWQEDETARLFSAVKEANATGAPLRSVFEALSDANINIQNISTSEIKISVLIDQKDADRAVVAVHDKLIN